jgi:hypothetical protein
MTQTWINFIAPDKEISIGPEMLCPSEKLKEIVEKWLIGEGYHGMFDLEPGLPLVNYPGKTSPALGCIWFDFDAKDQGDALKDARAFVEFLSPAQTLLFFSGGKGFHVGLPVGYTKLTPGTGFNLQARDLAKKLKAKFPTLDTGIYNAVRKFRLPNSKHDKSGLYKVQLTLDQLNQGLEWVRHYAKEPRPLNLEIVGTPPTLPQLEGLSEPIREKKEAGAGDPGALDIYARFEGKRCIEKMLKRRADEGEKHYVVLRIASDLFHTGVHFGDAEKTIQAWSDLHGVGDDGPLKVLEKVYGGQPYSFGCNDEYKSKYCSGKCPIYKRLAPDTRPPVLDAPKGLSKDKKREDLPTEHQLASAILERYGDRLIRQGECLFKYDGVRWQELDVAGIDQLKNAINELCENKLDSFHVNSAYRTLCRYVESVPPGVDLFIPHPFCANFLNGTLHLLRQRDGTYRLEFRPHQKQDYLVNVLPYEYKEGDTSQNEEFLRMLDRVFEGDPDKADKLIALQEMYGACLVSAFPRLFMLHGVPLTGKSTVAKIAKRLVHEDNLCGVEPSMFHGFHMQGMVGKLVNMDTDVDVQTPIRDAVIKKLIDRVPFYVQSNPQDLRRNIQGS